MSERLDAIEERAAKYRVRSALPQVEELQDDRDYLLTLARKQAAALEAVTKLAETWERIPALRKGTAAAGLREALEAAK